MTGRVWLGINRFETEKGVWTVVRVEGDSYSLRGQVKSFGAFKYGFPLDIFVALKQEAGIDSNEEFRKWLDRNADRREKRWYTHFSGAPEMNADKVRELAAGLGQACGLPALAVRERKPVVLGAYVPEPAQPEPEDDGGELPF